MLKRISIYHTLVCLASGAQEGLASKGLIFIMTSIPDWQQVQEAEYFNWRCIICHGLAKWPLHLEQQFLGRHGIYLDIDSCEWVKCSKYFNPYHVHCLNQKLPSNAEYICTFMSCNMHSLTKVSILTSGMKMTWKQQYWNTTGIHSETWCHTLTLQYTLITDTPHTL